jgi:hypothetical protein
VQLKLAHSKEVADLKVSMEQADWRLAEEQKSKYDLEDKILKTEKKLAGLRGELNETIHEQSRNQSEINEKEKEMLAA